MSDKLPFSPVTWYRQSRRGAAPPFEGQRVPCGSCTACCVHGRVLLYPPIDRPETYAHHREPDGSLALERHPDGHCLYLHEGVCLIYARRPLTCRVFDCRALLVADVASPPAVYAAAADKFDVVLKAPLDRSFVLAARRAVRLLHAQGKNGVEQLAGAFAAGAAVLD